jgi:antitoxin VapB
MTEADFDSAAHEWRWLDRIIGPVDEDFARAVSEEPAGQERPELDFFE